MHAETVQYELGSFCIFCDRVGFDLRIKRVQINFIGITNKHRTEVP